MNKAQAQRQQFQVLLDRPDTAVLAPLALDALTARLTEQAGFPAAYVSGGALGFSYGVSEALLTVTELADVTRRVIQPSAIPIIVDAGVGFGDAVHMTRTIREIEGSGAVAIEIEDQVAPKRVSHHKGIEHLISCAEMVDKIKVAVATRTDDSFLIIARTGAVKNESLAAAIERGNAYAEAGADLVMLMPEDAEQRTLLPQEISCRLATMAPIDARSAADWQALGWPLVIDPFTAQALAVRAVHEAYRHYQNHGTTGQSAPDIFSFYRELQNLAGLAPLYDIEAQTTERPTED